MCCNCMTSQLWRASQKSVAGPGRHRALSFAQPPVGQHAMVTDGTAGHACFSCCDVPTSRASDLSGLSCRLFCMYHSLTDVHAASAESPADVLSVRMARWSCESSAYWWYCTPCQAMTSPTGLQ